MIPSDLLSQRRIVLWCPYVHWHIAPTIASTAMGQMGSCKYQWFQRLIRAYRANIFVYCDSKHTSMVHYRGDVLAHLTNPDERKEIILHEARRWNELNNFQIPEENFFTRPKDIQAGDIVFTFSTYFLDAPITSDVDRTDLYRVFSREDIFKVAHLTHYMYWLGNLAENLRRLHINMLCYESNLATFKFFRQHVPSVRQVTLIPFAIQDRFQSNATYNERVNRCVVTGGTSKIPFNPGILEFFCEFSCDNLYPLRTLIAENAAALANYMHVKIGLYQHTMGEALKSPVGTILPWQDVLTYPLPEIAALAAQKKIPYYSEDIVSLYNRFRFSYVSDEITHAPALGFFEAMACGTVPIAVEKDYYRDVGLSKHINYVPFDGTFGGLLRTLVTVYNKPEAVRHIPANNAKIRQNFTEARIAELFVGKLTREYETWLTARAAPIHRAQPIKAA